MTGIQSEARNNTAQQIATMSLLIIAVALALVALSLIQPAVPAVSGSTAAQLSAVSPAGGRLSASAALATGKPVLFVFTPIEECAVHYCLTADVVERQVADSYGDQIHVVEIPVYAGHVYTDGTPPPLFADWDLYPVASFADWLPQAELTDFGWGLTQTRTVFVSADHENYHQFDNGLDMPMLDTLVKGHTPNAGTDLGNPN